MPSCIARAACLALVLAAGPALAGDLADFNAAAEAAEAHNRVAIGYLRTGNVDLASLEIDRLRAAWGKLGERFNGKRPEMFDGNNYYVVAMTDIATRLVTADLMLNMSKSDVTRQALLAIRTDLYKLRKSAGIVVLADCIYDANNAMDALMGYNDHDLDWNNAKTRTGISDDASSYGSALDRCDAMADPSLRQTPEFRRLVDGAKASLTLIPKAIATRDTDRLHRVLIELRSFDNLLAFRFG
ncbi:MAG TPA: hypothetical protein VFC45_10770 [Pseudolabrys sp.]|nr:hypothetical protein [Pseudolabrys sp.]